MIEDGDAPQLHDNDVDETDDGDEIYKHIRQKSNAENVIEPFRSGGIPLFKQIKNLEHTN